MALALFTTYLSMFRYRVHTKPVCRILYVHVSRDHASFLSPSLDLFCSHFPLSPLYLLHHSISLSSISPCYVYLHLISHMRLSFPPFFPCLLPPFPCPPSPFLQCSQAINDALRAVGATVQVVSGFIECVTVSVPWAALLKENCMVELSGLTLSLAPHASFKMEEYSKWDMPSHVYLYVQCISLTGLNKLRCLHMYLMHQYIALALLYIYIIYIHHIMPSECTCSHNGADKDSLPMC